MAATTEVTMQQLIDRVLARLVTPREFPLQVQVGATHLTASTSSTSLALVDATEVMPTDVLEFGQELVLVTAKDDATDLLTVARGYMGTTPDVALPGAVGYKSPRWPRHHVAQAVKDAMSGGLVPVVPELETIVSSVLSGGSLVPVDADTLDVVAVKVMDDQNRLIDLSRWDFMDHLPTAYFPTGKAVQVNSGPDDDDLFWVTLFRPYRWYDSDGDETTSPDETATTNPPNAGEDLPVLWAAATLATGRELSRGELDQVEEWNEQQAQQQGINIRLVRELWSEFYRRVDEVRKTYPVKRHRPYRKMRSF